MGKQYTFGKLTEKEITNAKAKLKPYKLADGGGLYLLVKPNGGKYWRFDYRYGDKRKTLALGVYHSRLVGLKTARDKAANAKTLLTQGIDPNEDKKAKAAEIKAKQQKHDHFEVVAKAWWQHEKGEWTNEHANRIWLRLEQNAFPLLSGKSIADIKPMDIIQVVKAIEARDALDVARRVKNDIRRVFAFAVQHELAAFNPASDLTRIVKTRKPVHQPAIPLTELPQFLRDMDSYAERGRLLTYLALRLLVLTFVRSGELRGAQWSEFDFEERLWRVPPCRMKMKTEHLVPLSRQAIEVLESIKLITGEYELLFPGERNRSKPMSDNTLRLALFRMGYDGKTSGKSKCVPHGIRAVASSLLNEQGFNRDAVEKQLSHEERNKTRGAYTHRAEYMPQRVELMQWLADHLDSLRDSSNVILFVKEIG